MTQRFHIHPDSPQPRLLRGVADVLAGGGLVALPTDACYVLACRLDDKAAVDRVRAIRALDDRHLLTLMCCDLSQLSIYAQVDNRQYRFLKGWTPGPYTFILPATRETPRRLWHPSRRTIGLRVPDSAIVSGVLEALGSPVISTSLALPGDEEPLRDPDEICERLARRIDLVVDAGSQSYVPTTVVDVTGDTPVVIRVAAGSIAGMVE
jgi:tRNA threonylcarbamoyl adenosine modification protein (Sua5/YciO/YrdC/YwlC family)